MIFGVFSLSIQYLQVDQRIGGLFHLIHCVRGVPFA
ncbi:hypothetical protein CA13_70140 [Planctomycetes bacterium CA13]|uniref:Uncharacterized protein n=1 Tax=Novipirellula herctigrandis TaxID=2527986 RepID=A0A5C5YNW9_9BACT|nr:hypothetical protein CA13_70140 [Planctomycetes bacterium CA13]